MRATEKQLLAWPEYVADAQIHMSTRLPSELNEYDWILQWSEETRPGRGHNLNAICIDGEYVVQIMLDVYGHGSVSVAETHWLHSSADEECDCDPCNEERLEDDHE